MEPLLDGEVSTLLRAWSERRQNALERLTPIVYDELHRLARRYMRRGAPRPQPADDRAGQRSLHATGGL